jgi:flagellar FliL protein
MPAPSEADSGAAGRKGKGFSVIGLIVEALAVTLIAGGAGAGYAWTNNASPDAQAQAQGQAPKAGEKAGEKGAAALCGPGPNLVDLPPIVTNIGSPADVWVRIEASIIVDGKTTPHAEILAAEIATDELAYLRTLSAAQFEGPIGLENIRQDLTDRAVVRSNGQVSELILKTLVLQ